MPIGTKLPNGQIKVAVSFPEALFRRLVRRAESDRRSFSATVSYMAECGLFDIEESEEHELEQIPSRL